MSILFTFEANKQLYTFSMPPNHYDKLFCKMICVFLGCAALNTYFAAEIAALLDKCDTRSLSEL